MAELDRHGVARAGISHAQTEAISPIDGNQLLEVWLDSDDRLIPQWSILPSAASLAQVQVLYDHRRASSVRLHDTRTAGLPFRPWAYNEPVWAPIYEFANERGLAVIFHTGPEPQSLPKFVNVYIPLSSTAG